MKHFFTTKVKVILVLALILAAGLGIADSLLEVNIGNMVVQGILTPIKTAARALTDQAEQYYSYMFRYEALLAENEALKEKIAEMEEDNRVAASVSRENDRLKALLGLKESHEDYQLVDAYIISQPSADWSYSYTVNKGSASGIETGMCAITANGEVVGLVTEVGTNYAVIKTILDSSLEISATMASTGYSGMVKGGYTSDQKGMLRMDYLPSSAVIRNNDQVVTSGSTVYPRDLILGYVVDAGFNDTGVAKFAILKPAADIDSLEQVFILTGYSVE